MTNKERFEKWWNTTKGADIKHIGLSSFTEKVMFASWQACAKLKDTIIADQLNTITALNACIGGEDSFTTDNLIVVGRLEAEVTLALDQLARANKLVEQKDKEIKKWKDRVVRSVQYEEEADIQVEELKAENERLRLALDRLARLGNEPHFGNSIGNDIAKDTLMKTTEQSLVEHDND